MIGGVRSVMLVLGLIPLCGAISMWFGPDAFGLTDTTADLPAARRLSFTLLGVTALAVGWAAYRRGASRWTLAWALAGAVAAVAFVLVLFLVGIYGAEEGTTDGGLCPAGRIYC